MNVHKLNPSGANEEQNQGSLINPKSSARCLELWSWHTSGGDGREDGAYVSLFGVENTSSEKIVET